MTANYTEKRKSNNTIIPNKRRLEPLQGELKQTSKRDKPEDTKLKEAKEILEMLVKMKSYLYLGVL